MRIELNVVKKEDGFGTLFSDNVEDRYFLLLVLEKEQKQWLEVSPLVEYDDDFTIYQEVGGNRYFCISEHCAEFELVGKIDMNTAIEIDDDSPVELDLINFDISGEGIHSCDYYYFKEIEVGSKKDSQNVIKYFGYDKINKKYFELVEN